MFSNTDEFLKDFQTIVNIDSSSDHLPGIETVARFFQKRLSAIGFKVEILFQGDAKVPCLQAVFGPGNSPGPEYDLMFLGHMDTVFSFGEVEKRGFSIQGDKALGPGVCDMKGGLLVVLHVLETLKKEGALDKMSLCVAFNGDEETGSKASKEWIKTTAGKSRRVFVFEPCRPGYKMVSQRKGGGWFHITATGKEAHAGADPEKGINAGVQNFGSRQNRQAPHGNFPPKPGPLGCNFSGRQKNGNRCQFHCHRRMFRWKFHICPWNPHH